MYLFSTLWAGFCGGRLKPLEETEKRGGNETVSLLKPEKCVFVVEGFSVTVYHS